MFLKVLDCPLIRIPTSALSNPHHRWGPGGAHYIQECYDYLLSAVDSVRFKEGNLNSIYDDSEEANITAFIEKLRKLKKRLAIEEIQQEIISNYKGVMPNELRLLLKKRKYSSEVIEEISKMKRKCDLRKAK